MDQNLTWDIQQALYARDFAGSDAVGEYWDHMLRGRRKQADLWLMFNRPELITPPCPQRARFIRLIDMLYCEQREARHGKSKEGRKGLRKVRRQNR